MTLEDINKKLEFISLSIEGLDSLTNEKIEELSKDVSNLQNMDVFDKSDEISFKDGDDTLDFETIIASNIEKLNTFDSKEYFKELNNKDFSKVVENSKIAQDRENKIKELVSKIERIGKMNTIINETKNRYSEKSFDQVFETQDKVNTSRLEDENKRITIMAKYNDEIQEDLKILDYIEEVKKLEEENKKIQDKINAIESKKIGLPTDFQDVLQEEIDKENEKIINNEKTINERNTIINGRTADYIKIDMLGKLPAELRQPEVEAAINSDNPRDAYNKLISRSQNEILKYQNRIDKNAEMKEKVEIGRETRNNLKKAKPISYKAEDYSLDDDELLAIEEEIKNGGDKIDELVEKATNEINSLPIPAGKDLRKQAKAWLDMQNGETKNPFKNIARRIKAYSEKTQNQYMDAYKKQQINEKVKNALIDEKKIEKYNSMIETKKTETKTKLQTLSNRQNSWKESLFVDLSKLSNDDLDGITKEGKYGELAAEQYKKVADKEEQEADDGFTH